MGVQINFFIDELQRKFVNYVYDCSYKIMDCKTQNGKLNIYGSCDEVVYTDRPLYIFDPYDLNYIFIKSWGQIDPLNSNIIEFMNTSVNEEKILKSQPIIDLYFNLRKQVKKNTKYILTDRQKKYISDEIINLISKGYRLN